MGDLRTLLCLDWVLTAVDTVMLTLLLTSRNTVSSKCLDVSDAARHVPVWGVSEWECTWIHRLCPNEKANVANNQWVWRSQLSKGGPEIWFYFKFINFFFLKDKKWGSQTITLLPLMWMHLIHFLHCLGAYVMPVQGNTQLCKLICLS